MLVPSQQRTYLGPNWWPCNAEAYNGHQFGLFGLSWLSHLLVSSFHLAIKLGIQSLVPHFSLFGIGAHASFIVLSFVRTFGIPDTFGLFLASYIHLKPQTPLGPYLMQVPSQQWTYLGPNWRSCYARAYNGHQFGL